MDLLTPHYASSHNGVGRDFAKALPGVYWRTAFTLELQRRLGIPRDALETLARSV